MGELGVTVPLGDIVSLSGLTGYADREFLGTRGLISAAAASPYRCCRPWAARVSEERSGRHLLPALAAIHP
ncbi:hypothetical protein O0544_14000 [Edwardsiella anguillarum]|nr:hypothetical protein [Edwardsiella anguillarum]